MALLIPATISPRTSAGERELFYRLREDPRTEDWVIFHSVEVRRHLAKIEGEIDLIAVVPGEGILCIEVKACDVSRNKGTWFYPYGTSSEGPFKQVSRAMHSLRKWLANSDAAFGNLLFFSAVAFTEIDFSEKSLEWYPWQVINKTDLLSCSPARLITDVLEKAHLLVKQKAPVWYSAVKSRPTPKTIKRITDVLRRDFEYQESGRAPVERLERAIYRFTDEQMVAVDQLAENERVIFKGPAGTGKTFIALEAAGWALERGMSVGLFCYNKLLGEWLEIQTRGLAQLAESSNLGFYAGSFHRFLLEHVPSNNLGLTSPAFWQHDLPARVCERFLTGASVPSFDFVILDEAQDLVTASYLDVLDLVLPNGLRYGRWAMFGDFERQAIYVSPGEVSELLLPAMLKIRVGAHATFNLKTNCRNAKRVAETLTVISGLIPGYRRLLHEADTGEVDPVFYSTAGDQRNKLQVEIERLLRKFRPHEIIVVSLRAPSQSCAATLMNQGNLPFSLCEMITARDGQHGSILFTSIHRFKGLEAPAIILTDLEKMDDEQSKSLLYVGMSRARIQLVLLMHIRLTSTYQSLLLANLRQMLDEEH